MSTTPPTPPVKVKLYGFLPVTRRAYYMLLSMGVVLLAALLFFWFQTPRQEFDPETALPGTLMWAWLWNHIPWIVLAAVLLEAVEVWYVLRKFSQEEARHRTSGS